MKLVPSRDQSLAWHNDICLTIRDIVPLTLAKKTVGELNALLPEVNSLFLPEETKH